MIAQPSFEAGVQLLVAVNKCDKPGVNPARIREALMQHGLVAEEYGGETIFVNVSALKGTNIDQLLEAILLMAEVGEYRANRDRHAEGVVLEARLERGRGPVATVLVQRGTLKRGDAIVLGQTWGKVRAMSDHTGKAIKEAGPSTPVEVIGIGDVPLAGDDFVVVENEKDAKALCEHRAERARSERFVQPTRVTLEDLMARAQTGEMLSLNLILKADVGGSLEALRQAFSQIKVEGTEVKVLHSGVGAVSESDVVLSHTYGGIVIAFNVRPDTNARRKMDEFGVEVRTYTIIYEAIADVEKALKGLLAPRIQEVIQGQAEIRQIFKVPKIGAVAGCFVTEGKIARPHLVRLLRDSKVVFEGKLASLKRFKDDVRDVEKGYECGMGIEGYNDIKIGDVIEAYTRETVAALD